MCNQNEWIVREAFLAYLRGDVARMMDYVAEDLDWTHFGLDQEDPRPLVCRGRGELEKALHRQADLGLQPEVEEVVAAGDRVMLVMRTPGIDGYLHRPGDDRTYDIVTVRDGLIVALRACRDRSEARSLAGIG
jgi:ketosteroid isomerase-like protein